MRGNSKAVTTNQQGVHEKLKGLVNRYLHSENHKPIQQHTQDVFTQVVKWINQQQITTGEPPIILDSCCGVGESTWRLAQAHPHALVIGVDKSLDRVQKHGQQLTYQEYASYGQHRAPMSAEKNLHVINNYCVVRANVIDFNV